MMIKPKLNSALKTKVISIIPSVVHTMIALPAIVVICKYSDELCMYIHKYLSFIK